MNLVNLVKIVILQILMNLVILVNLLNLVNLVNLVNLLVTVILVILMNLVILVGVVILFVLVNSVIQVNLVNLEECSESCKFGHKKWPMVNGLAEIFIWSKQFYPKLTRFTNLLSFARLFSECSHNSVGSPQAPWELVATHTGLNRWYFLIFFDSKIISKEMVTYHLIRLTHWG